MESNDFLCKTINKCIFKDDFAFMQMKYPIIFRIDNNTQKALLRVVGNCDLFNNY